MVEWVRTRSAGAILVNARGEMLLQQRDNKPELLYPGCWSTFGGAVEADETPHEAIRRELLEEIELEPSLTLWQTFTHEYIYQGRPTLVEQYVYYGAVDLEADEIALNEGQALAFFNRADLETLPVAFWFEPLLAAFFDTRPDQLKLRFTRAALADAPLVHRIMRAGFAEYAPVLNPSSGALSESAADVAAAMQQGGAVLAWLGDTPAASARWRLDADALYVGRVAVLPELRQQGIGTALMRFMETVAREQHRDAVRVSVRMQLPQNITFYERLGYTLVETVAHPRGPDRIATLTKAVSRGGRL